MKACVLAGGFGTRLRSCVSEVPKPLAPINQRPFLELLLDYWIAQGVRSFYLLTGYLGHLIEEHFEGSYKGADIFCLQEKKSLGTGGALAHAFQKFSEFEEGFVINGDTFFEVDAKKMKNFHNANKAEMTLALRQVEHNDRYSGLVLSSQGRVISFLKREADSKELLINGGVYYLGLQGVKALKCIQKESFSLEDDFFPEYLIKASLFGFVQKARFIDIGIPSDYQKAFSFFSSYAPH